LNEAGQSRPGQVIIPGSRTVLIFGSKFSIMGTAAFKYEYSAALFPAFLLLKQLTDK
jgi:hypothetical protein